MRKYLWGSQSNDTISAEYHFLIHPRCPWQVSIANWGGGGAVPESTLPAHRLQIQKEHVVRCLGPWGHDHIRVCKVLLCFNQASTLWMLLGEVSPRVKQICLFIEEPQPNRHLWGTNCITRGLSFISVLVLTGNSKRLTPKMPLFCISLQDLTMVFPVYLLSVWKWKLI